METSSDSFESKDLSLLPLRMENTNFHKYSKISKNLTTCPNIVFEQPVPVNESSPNE